MISVGLVFKDRAKLAIAIEFMKEGRSFPVGDLRF